MTYTKEQMFDWLCSSRAEIKRERNMKHTREDGTEFHSDFILCSGGTQWPPFPTLPEAIQFAMNYKEI